MVTKFKEWIGCITGVRAVTILYLMIVASLSVICLLYYNYIENSARLIGDIESLKLAEEYFLLEIYLGLMAFSSAIYVLVNKLTKKYDDEILRQANFDALTGLPNRNSLHKELQKRIEKAKKDSSSVAVFFIDLDDFKQVNDTYNHFVGDQLLKEVSERFRKILRKDDYVARLGGDEFVVVASNHDNERRKAVDIYRIAQSLHDATTSAIHFEDLTLYSNSSIGIATYPNISKTSSGLLRKADLAMYASKKHGKNQTIVYTQAVERASIFEFELKNQLREAVANEEFSLVYQPKFDMGNNRLDGFEALVRWNNPDYPAVGPDVFIPILEKLQIIDRLGTFVLDQAAKDFAEYSKHRDIDCVRMGVNMSALQFQNPNIATEVKQTLARHGVLPRHFEIEITESALVDEYDETDTVDKLSGMGVSIAIDDFGTGYSSLKKLNELNIDVIKIDKSFIEKIGIDKTGETLIKTILKLGDTLGTYIVAEGVETLPQFEFLKIHYPQIIIQGYLYSKPLTLEELIQFQAPDLKKL